MSVNNQMDLTSSYTSRAPGIKAFLNHLVHQELSFDVLVDATFILGLCGV